MNNHFSLTIEDDLSDRVARGWMRINDTFDLRAAVCVALCDVEAASRILNQHYEFNLAFRDAADSLAAAEVVQRWTEKLSIGGSHV